jgi:hypothetical protein
MKKIIQRKIIYIILLILPFFIYGCFGVDSNFKKIRNEVFRVLNAGDIDREFEYKASNFEVYLASKVASISDNMLYAEMLLEKISNVQVGVYKLGEYKSLSRKSFLSLEQEMKNNGWSRIVTTCSRKDMCFIYVDIENNEKIKDAIVLNIDSEQLVMIEVRGKLDKFIEQIIKNRGIRV